MLVRLGMTLERETGWSIGGRDRRGLGEVGSSWRRNGGVEHRRRTGEGGGADSLHWLGEGGAGGLQEGDPLPHGGGSGGREPRGHRGHLGGDARSL